MMEFSIFVFLMVLILASMLLHGLRRVNYLRDAPLSPLPSFEQPFVSIIVAARNEEKNIEGALLSLLQLDYRNKEVIVVNDRSNDNTARILERVHKKVPELQVLTVTSLPSGWLGKNHAHYMGSQAARGEIFLFTDADIVMERSVLSRAIGYLKRNVLDHLAILPEVQSRSVPLKLVMVGFQVFFNGFTRVWNVSNPKSRAFVGIGAFNMIRRAAYAAIGTHKTIRLRPDDDMQLGRWIKKRGLRQGFLFGTSLIKVEWYASLRELIEGLMKNSFSAANYHLSIVLGGSLFILTFLMGPFLGIFLTTGPVRFFYGAAVLLLLACAVDSARTQDQNPFLALGFPLSMVLMLYIVWKASIRTLWRGGIEWRGTFYSLKELRSSSADHG